jgi:predicted kinase
VATLHLISGLPCAGKTTYAQALRAVSNGDRLRYRNLAITLGATTTVHFVNASIEVVRHRIRRRNADLPSHNFQIDDETLIAFVGLFEPPCASEGVELVITDQWHDAAPH